MAAEQDGFGVYVESVRAREKDTVSAIVRVVDGEVVVGSVFDRIEFQDDSAFAVRLEVVRLEKARRPVELLDRGYTGEIELVGRGGDRLRDRVLLCGTSRSSGPSATE